MGINNFSNVFFTKVQQHLLRVFLCHPERSFYTNELIHLTHCGTGAVQRELKKLKLANIVNMQQIGNQKRYQANVSSPIYAELRAIALKTFALTDVLTTALKIIEKKMIVAFVYGSIAKQTDTLYSDIDLMIISDQLTYSDIFQQLEEVTLQLGRKINPTIYSLKQWQSKLKNKNNFLLSVLEQPKIFLIGNESELREFS